MRTLEHPLIPAYCVKKVHFQSIIVVFHAHIASEMVRLTVVFFANFIFDFQEKILFQIFLNDHKLMRYFVLVVVFFSSLLKQLAGFLCFLKVESYFIALCRSPFLLVLLLFLNSLLDFFLIKNSTVILVYEKNCFSLLSN